MSKFTELCLILLTLGVCLGQFPQFNVTHTDMLKQMRDFTVCQILILHSNATDVKVMAEKLTEIMNLKYGKGWFSLVGTNTAINGFNTELNTTIEFQYEATKVTISQQKILSCNDSSLDNKAIIERAHNSTMKVIYSSSQEFCNKMLNETQNILLSYNYDGCLNKREIKNWHKTCAFKISQNLLFRLGSDSQISVGFDSYFNSDYATTNFNYCNFILGDIQFNIRIPV